MFALVIVAVAVTAVCANRGWPAPLVLFGVALGVSLIPGGAALGDPARDPARVRPAAAAVLGGPGGLLRRLPRPAGPIVQLGVGLVVVTAVAVAVVYWSLDARPPAAGGPGARRGRGPAGRRLGGRDRPTAGAPPPVMTVLSGESLIDEAASLTSSRSRWPRLRRRRGAAGRRASVTFGLAVAVGVALGLAIGWAVHLVRVRLDDPVVTSVLGVVVPFGAYCGRGAVRLRGAGRGGRRAVPGPPLPRAGYASRLQERPLWSSLDLLLQAVVFALIGLQLPWVVRDVIASDQGLRHGVVLSLGVLRRRDPGATGLHLRAPRGSTTCACAAAHRPALDSLSARESAVVSWAGMRGVVTLAAAAAIPLTVERRAVPRARDPAARRLLRGHRHAAHPGPHAALGHPPAEGRVRRRDRAATPRRRPRSGWPPPTPCRTCSSGSASDWSRHLGPERAGELIDKLSAAWRARATAAAVMLDPSSADELVPDEGLRPEAVSGRDRAPSATVSPSERPDARRRAGGRRQLQREIVVGAAGGAHAVARLRASSTRS